MRNHQLKVAVRAALAAGALATAVAAPSAFAQEDESADLDRVTVTGSRIKRTDIEGALPVTVIDRETIELSGETSVSDLLRNQPINSGGSFRPRSGSSGQSFAGLSLRALGEGRTLILIDGRRAPVAPNIGQGQDLNAVPLAAVERIEILSDGASAIYGTDAIGGVVNIITRKDYTGAQVSIGAGFPKRKGGETDTASAIFGAASQQGQIMAGVSYNKRDIVFQRDREWSAGGASTFSNNFLVPRFDADGEFIGSRFVGVGTAGANDGPTGPGNEAGCQDPSFIFEDGFCFYDFTAQAADEAMIENTSVFARARYDINMDWSLYGNFSVNRVESFGRYAPVPSSPWLVGGFGAIRLEPGSPNHPGTPYNPNFGVDGDFTGGLNPNSAAYAALEDDLLLLRHRFAANGPRDTNTDANVYDYAIGVEGRIGNFDLEAGLRRVDSQYYDIGRNYIVSALAQPQIDSGAYNIYDPTGNPQEVLQSFTATLIRDARFVSNEAFAIASTEIGELPAGPIGVAFGAEYRDEDYRDLYDDLSANGNITGSAGNSAFGSRDQYALFTEVLVPVLEDLELTFAGRYDDYSDFGSEFSPKIAFRWQPLSEVTVRGSWGTGFRAPTLDILSAQPSFSADSVRDPATCLAFGQPADCQTQITGFVIANPDIGAEQSDQFSFGVAYEPFDWLNGSIDYFNIEVTDRVAGISAQTIVNCLAGTTTNCPPGLSDLSGQGLTPPAPQAGLGIARNADGSIQFLQRGFASLGTIQTDGVDLKLNTDFDFGTMGRLTNELVVTHTMTYEIDSGANLAGLDQLPDWRGILRNVYTFGDFSFAWNLNYIGPQDDAQTATLFGLPSQTTHDLQVNYFTPWNSRVTVGVDNVGDEDPVLDPADSSGRGYNVDLYDPYGRVVYVRYQQDF